jgi:adenylate cyclase
MLRNFNLRLRYLNLSGNKRLEIKRANHKEGNSNRNLEYRHLEYFSSLKDLKVLGLMEVTLQVPEFEGNIPEDSEECRVRTSSSEVHNMAYGIADTLGQSLTMFDFVRPNFRGREGETIFGMFGRASHIGSNHHISKYLQGHVSTVLKEEVDRVERYNNGTVVDAMRRTFLKLNKDLHDYLYSQDPRRASAINTSAGASATNTSAGASATNTSAGVSAASAPAGSSATSTSAGAPVTNTSDGASATSTSAGASATGTSVGAPSGFDYASYKSGACGIVLYLVEKTLYVAHVGSALAVISRQGNAELLTKLHDPFDRDETTRIRSAEGWVSPKGLVNDEVDVSRSFGFYYLLPVVCARPEVTFKTLDALDEFVIIGNRALWDYVSYQTAVDIVRKVPDPMVAAQKLRDFAMSYGAEGTTMIMVIRVGDLFDCGRSRQQTLDPVVDDAYLNYIRTKKDDISNRDIYRLGLEVPAPTGHIALVFTDIRNSTHLWEANQGMQTAISSHNSLLRRHLRLCGGYEVKTEGDAFMCAFPNTLTAVWWCLTVQVQLLQVAWPLEILECEDGKEICDEDGRLIARGLSVRMGIHCGKPIPDPDPTTRRMDYLGPVVNRSARITNSAAGGQIMCSADVIREINATVFEKGPPTEYSRFQSSQAIEAIRRLDVKIFPFGEVKLKGLEVPEKLSLIYPGELTGRHGLENLSGESASGSRVQFSVEQMRELAMLCIRLETLTSSRVFRPLPTRKSSTVKAEDEKRLDPNPVFLYGNPDVLLPNMQKASDAELALLLDSLSSRIENALAALTMKQIAQLNKGDRGDLHTRRSGATFDVRVLQQLMSLLPTL